jgi:hypothetical protein
MNRCMRSGGRCHIIARREAQGRRNENEHENEHEHEHENRWLVGCLAAEIRR